MLPKWYYFASKNGDYFASENGIILQAKNCSLNPKWYSSLVKPKNFVRCFCEHRRIHEIGKSCGELIMCLRSESRIKSVTHLPPSPFFHFYFPPTSPFRFALPSFFADFGSGNAELRTIQNQKSTSRPPPLQTFLIRGDAKI